MWYISNLPIRGVDPNLAMPGTIEPISPDTIQAMEMGKRQLQMQTKRWSSGAHVSGAGPTFTLDLARVMLRPPTLWALGAFVQFRFGSVAEAWRRLVGSALMSFVLIPGPRSCYGASLARALGRTLDAARG